MKAKVHPALFFAVLYVAFLTVVMVCHDRMPERLATHFNAAGQPNGWSTRAQWRATSLLLGTALPIAVLGAFWVLRFVPARSFNLPHRDYWLGAEQRAETLAFLLRHGWWLASLEVAFFIGMEWLVVAANTFSPPRLATPPILALAAVFVAGLVLWIVQMRRRFARPQEQT